MGYKVQNWSACGKNLWHLWEGSTNMRLARTK